MKKIHILNCGKCQHITINKGFYCTKFNFTLYHNIAPSCKKFTEYNGIILFPNIPDL